MKRKVSMADRFERFHRDNPEFYAKLGQLAHEYRLRTGSGKVGTQRLIEIARWDRQVETAAADFKVSNDYVAFYARLLMFRDRSLQGAFPIRKSREADEWIEQLKEYELKAAA